MFGDARDDRDAPILGVATKFSICQNHDAPLRVFSNQDISLRLAEGGEGAWDFSAHFLARILHPENSIRVEISRCCESIVLNSWDQARLFECDVLEDRSRRGR